MEDKYIGLALAMSSSLAIGTSFIITKKGLMDASARSGNTNGVQALQYLQNPIWWVVSLPWPLVKLPILLHIHLPLPF